MLRGLRDGVRHVEHSHVREESSGTTAHVDIVILLDVEAVKGGAVMVRPWLGLVGGLLLSSSTVLAPAGVAAAPAEPSASVQVAAQCPDPVGKVDLASVAQTESLLVGTWIQCEGEPLPLPPGDNVGIQFDADGTYYRVYEVDGSLVRTAGLLEQGTWRVIDTTDMNGPGSYQLNLTTLGSGTWMSFPEFFGTPTQLLHVGESAAFVPWTGAPPTDGVPPGIGEGPCGLPTDPVDLTSVAQVEQLLVNTWVRCGDDSALGPVLPGEVGLEMAADGRFYRLYDDGQGGLIRASGDGQEGTWTILDTTDANGPGWYQLNLAQRQGTAVGHVVVLQQPTHFRFLGYSFADYQLWTGPAPVPGDPPSAPTPPPATEPVDELPPTGTTGAVGTVALALLACGIVAVRIGRNRTSRTPHHDPL